MSTIKTFSDKIRKQIEEDPNNPDIFNNLRLLANFYFRGVKFVDNEQQLEEISNIAAEDMYMRVYNGMKLYNPIGFLYKFRYTYFKEMKKIEYTEVIECEDYDMTMGLLNMCVGSSISLENSYDVIWIKDYLQRIPQQVDYILSKCCRYKKGTSIYRNIYTSIMLSLYKDDIIPLFISSKIHNYFLLMLNKVKDELFDDIKNNLLDNNLTYDGNLDMLLNILRLSNVDRYIPEVLDNE